MPNTAVTVTANFENIPPVVTGVTVSPATAEVYEGGTQQFAATVAGDYNPPSTVTWSVEAAAPGELMNGTGIDADGLLTVAPDQLTTGAALTITATSTYDTTKSGTASVTVTLTPPAPVYEIALDTTGHTFTGVTAGYAAQTPFTVTVTNTGKGIRAI